MKTLFSGFNYFLNGGKIQQPVSLGSGMNKGLIHIDQADNLSVFTDLSPSQPGRMPGPVNSFVYLQGCFRQKRSHVFRPVMGMHTHELVIERRKEIVIPPAEFHSMRPKSTVLRNAMPPKREAKRHDCLSRIILTVSPFLGQSAARYILES